MHVGSTGGTINTAPFRVYFDGSMYATKGQIGGWNISSTNLDTKYLFNQTINDVSETWTRHISIQSASGENSRAFAVREIKGDERGNNPNWQDWTYRFYVENSGKLYAENAEIKGTITATAGKIGSWSIIPDPKDRSMYILGTDFKKDNDYYGIGFRPMLLRHYVYNNASLPVFAIGKFNSTWYGEADYIPSTGLEGNWESANFFVTADGTLHAKDAEITGTITADEGTIGGFTIDDNNISNNPSNFANSTFMCTGTNSSYTIGGHTGTGWCFGAGGKFGVKKDGSLYATSATIKGTLQVGSKIFGSNSISLFQDNGGNGFRHEANGYTHQISFSSTKLHLESKTSTYKTYMTLHPHSNSLSPGDAGWQASLILGVSGTGQYGLLAGNWRVGSLTDSAAITSDVNLKNSINIMDEKYENFFDDIKPITYKYNDSESDRTHTGYIAQQIGEALTSNGLTNQDFAGLVITNYNLLEDEPQRWCLRYEEFVSLNTWQIQKAKARITELEDRVAQLEALIKE